MALMSRVAEAASDGVSVARIAVVIQPLGSDVCPVCGSVIGWVKDYQLPRGVLSDVRLLSPLVEAVLASRRPSGRRSRCRYSCQGSLPGLRFPFRANGFSVHLFVGSISFFSAVLLYRGHLLLS